MLHEQYKKMNMLVDFQYFMEFIDTLGLDVEAHFEKQAQNDEPDMYSLNGENIFVEFKNEVRPQYASIFEPKNNKLPTLIASKYITPKAKNILKTKKTNYLDSYGNAYIQLPQLKVFIEQNNAKPIATERSKIFTQAGGQLIFQLLQRPEEVNETVRRLAHISNISVGSVSKIINGLFDERFLVHWNNEKKYQLVRKKELLERWIPLVNEKILPNYKIGTYSFTGDLENHWKTEFLRPNVWWTGEPGAALLTDYLHPEKYALFTTLSKSEILSVLKLVPDSNGQLTLYRPFWGNTNATSIINPKEINKPRNTVSPLIIYAQLVYSAAPRNIETAQIIYDEHIAPKL